MAIETKESTINGKRYIVSQLPATASLRLLARLGRVLGPALGEVFATASKSGAKNFLDADVNFGKIATLLFDKLDEKEVGELLPRLCEGAIVVENGKQHPMMTGFDVEYAGAGMVELFEALKFVLEVQYGPTFAALLAARAATLPAAPAASA